MSTYFIILLVFKYIHYPIIIMDEQRILEKIKEFAEKLPKFPDGRINYKHSEVALTITVFITYNEKLLILKRSNKVLAYKGKWGTVAGYLDELKPIQEKILEEIKEEIGVERDKISSIYFGEPYEFTDHEINKTWIIHPSLVELKEKPDVKLDWEHDEYRWIKPEESKNFDTFPGFEESLRRATKRF